MQINSAQSLALDAIRGSAAVIVLFYHFSDDIAPQTTPLFPDMGKEAVIAFFVLSGFVIYGTSTNVAGGFSCFFAKRSSRFYSTIIPAILLSLGLYYLSEEFDPGLYSRLGRGSDDSLLTKSIGSLLFLNHTRFASFDLPGFGPYWSVVCEWWYYWIFSLLFFFHGICSKLVALTCLAFLNATAVLFFPIWLMGCFSYRLYTHRQISCYPAVILLSACFFSGIFLWQSGSRYSTFNIEKHTGFELGHSASFPYFWLIAAFFSIALYSTLCILAKASTLSAARNKIVYIAVRIATPIIRTIAGSSFFLYLMHMPVMIAILALAPHIGQSWYAPMLTLLICTVVGSPIEKLRHPLFKVISTRL